MLYRADSTFNDSTIYKERPMYFTRLTDKRDSTFRIDNISPGNYHLIAMVDDNSNMLYDQAKDKYSVFPPHRRSQTRPADRIPSASGPGTSSVQSLSGRKPATGTDTHSDNRPRKRPHRREDIPRPARRFARLLIYSPPTGTHSVTGTQARKRTRYCSSSKKTASLPTPSTPKYANRLK